MYRHGNYRHLWHCTDFGRSLGFNSFLSSIEMPVLGVKIGTLVGLWECSLTTIEPFTNIKENFLIKLNYKIRDWWVCLCVSMCPLCADCLLTSSLNEVEAWLVCDKKRDCTFILSRTASSSAATLIKLSKHLNSSRTWRGTSTILNWSAFKTTSLQL